MAPEHHDQQQQPRKRHRDNDNIGSIGRSSSNDNDNSNIIATTSTNTNKPTIRNSATNDDDEKINAMAFIRVVDRRRKEVTTLEPAFVRALLLEIRSLTGLHFEILSSSKVIDTEKAGNDIKELIMRQYRIITDVDAPSNRRRRSWDVINEIFHLIGTNGESATDENNYHQRKKVKYTGKIITSASITAYTSNATTQITADATTTTTAPNPKSQNSAIVDTSASHAEASLPQVLISNRGNNNTTTSVNGITKRRTQNQPSMTENKTRNCENNETNTNSSSTNNRKNSIRTVASLSAASASTSAVAISSNSTTVVHPSMVGKSSTSSVTVNVNNGNTAPIGVIPPPYQERSYTVLDHRIDSQNRNTSGKNENKKHPAMNRNGSAGVRNGEINNIPVHPAMRHKAHTAKPAQTTTATNNTNNSKTTTTGSSFNDVRSTTAKKIRAVSTSTALNAVSASSSSSTSSLRQGMVTNTTAIPETVLSNKINMTTSAKSFSPQKLKFEAAVSTVELPADNLRNNSFAGYVDSRPSIKLSFRQCLPTANMKHDFGKRLLQWDPYWKVEKMLCMGLTARVSKRTYERNEDIPSEDEIATPNTAASFKIDQLLKMVGPKLRQINQGQSPRDCEYRVLVRMIPLHLTNEQSEKRADVHIWPKGTYFQVHAAPSNGSKPMAQRLIQRKQQSHNLTKWSGICHCLDLTSLLHNSWSSSTTSLKSFPYSVFEFGCHDSDIYMFSLALCKYESPQTLTKSLLDKGNKTLKRLTLEESYDRAINMMKDNEVTLDDSDDEDNNNDKDHHKKSSSTGELKRIHFSLKDKVSLTTIKTPVRGRKCCHFSCFDLGYYLEVNKGASGQRWKCGLCEDFLSYEDLELCALTELGLKQFGGEMTAGQHMVEFREDKTLELMKPARSRQERTQAKNSVNQASLGAASEPVDLLSDSD